MRLPDMPNQEPQVRVRVAIGRIDLLAPSLEARFAGRIEQTAGRAAPEDAAAA
jgi:hypothetical protein